MESDTKEQPLVYAPRAGTRDPEGNAPRLTPATKWIFFAMTTVVSFLLMYWAVNHILTFGQLGCLTPALLFYVVDGVEITVEVGISVLLMTSVVRGIWFVERKGLSLGDGLTKATGQYGKDALLMQDLIGVEMENMVAKTQSTIQDRNFPVRGNSSGFNNNTKLIPKNN